MKYRVKIKPNAHHDNYVAGDEIEVSELELKAFGDKFKVLDKVEETLPESDSVMNEDELLGLPDENVHISDTPEPLDITPSALAYAEENGLIPEAHMLKGKGSGKEGRILLKDLQALE